MVTYLPPDWSKFKRRRLTVPREWSTQCKCYLAMLIKTRWYKVSRDVPGRSPGPWWCTTWKSSQWVETEFWDAFYVRPASRNQHDSSLTREKGRLDPEWTENSPRWQYCLTALIASFEVKESSSVTRGLFKALEVFCAASETNPKTNISVTVLCRIRVLLRNQTHVEEFRND